MSLQKDKDDFDNSMSRQYNLNFTNDDIFESKADNQFEIKNGLREDVVWQPIKPRVDMVRWNSYHQAELSSLQNSNQAMMV